MIELLLPCGFDTLTLEYSWVKATIGICMLADYSMAKKRQQTLALLSCLLLLNVLFFEILMVTVDHSV
jgi:uncharacterized membrane protein